MIVVRFWKC